MCEPLPAAAFKYRKNICRETFLEVVVGSLIHDFKNKACNYDFLKDLFACICTCVNFYIFRIYIPELRYKLNFFEAINGSFVFQYFSFSS